jgi:hypothetical protein
LELIEDVGLETFLKLIEAAKRGDLEKLEGFNMPEMARVIAALAPRPRSRPRRGRLDR